MRKVAAGPRDMDSEPMFALNAAPDAVIAAPSVTSGNGT
jgi:hypothetical protein